MTLALAVLGWAILAPPGQVLASAAQPSEYQVKAAMIYNMAKFVDWPEDSFPVGNAPFSICVLGNGPLGVALDALHGKTIKGRRVVVRHVSQVEEKGACPILVIGKSERSRLHALLRQLNQHGVLTIGDAPRFASAGGIVGFVELGGNITFEINLEAARQSGLKISSQLLKLAHIVRDGE